MQDILALASANLLTPMILCFALGLFAALARSELTIPEAVAKGMSIYLLFSIGFKGGVAVADHGLDGTLIAALVAGVVLSFLIPFVAFGLLKAMTRLSATDAAAVAAHYGSISIVTFVTGSSVVQGAGLVAEGYMVAVAAAMEAPAIISALYLASRSGGRAEKMDADLWREILLNGSIVLLVGAFLIGMVTGDAGMQRIEAFIVAPFQGVLCLFLLDMGLVAGRGMRNSRGVLTPGVLIFGLLMPVVGAGFGLAAGLLLGLSTGGVALMMVLAGSASYIAVPAAMRVALPDANPSIYLTLSLGVTFPFNLVIGIPAWVAVAQAVGAEDMQTHKAKRVEIIIEAPMEGRLTAALEKAGVTGFTVLPVFGGSGRSGRWTRDGQVGRSGMVAVVCLIRPDRLDALLDAAYAVVERHIGVIGVTDAEVLRAERF